LKAFAKTNNLTPGEATRVTMSFPISELRYWSEEQSRWILEPGIYEIRVGVSSRDIRQWIETEL
jgi:beta-glucosidase